MYIFKYLEKYKYLQVNLKPAKYGVFIDDYGMGKT